MKLLRIVLMLMVATLATTCKSQPFFCAFKYDTTISVENNILEIDIFLDTINQKSSYFYTIKTRVGVYSYDCDYCRLIRKEDQVLFYNTYVKNSNSNSYKKLLKKVVSISNIELSVLSRHTFVEEERIYDFLFKNKILTVQEYDRLTAYLSWRANVVLNQKP
ncbi:MAG: hypothetical protein AB8G11_04005 [Saprospiraceae bacterium]